MNRDEIIAAARSVISEIKEAFVMGTVSPEGTPHVFYMGTAVAEEPFTLYLETFADSTKVRHIRANPHVELVMTRQGYETVLTVTGIATIESSPAVKQKVWDQIPLSARYFSGPDAPEFGVIKVTAMKLKIQRMADDPLAEHVTQL